MTCLKEMEVGPSTIPPMELIEKLLVRISHVHFQFTNLSSGYVTSGAYSYVRTSGSGIGFCAVKYLSPILNDPKRYLCLCAYVFLFYFADRKV